MTPEPNCLNVMPEFVSTVTEDDEPSVHCRLTLELRWLDHGFVGLEQRTLQQKWVCDDGSEKWENVMVVREEA